jgi:hypothetical protein
VTDLLIREEQNRKEAEKFSDLAKNASSPFLRDYYRRIAARYLLLEGEWRPLETKPVHRTRVTNAAGPSL